MMYLAVFLAMTALDFVYAEYTREIADGRRLPASLWAMAIIGLGAYVTTSYVDNHALVLPAMLGAFAGTWLSITMKDTPVLAALIRPFRRKPQPMTRDIP